MGKEYYVEARLHTNRWTLLKTERRQTDALQYVKDHAGEKYPMRIVRVTRTVVFEDGKK